MTSHRDMQAAKRAANRGPFSYRWKDRDYEIAWESIVVYDDPDTAEAIASFLGTYAKHSKSRFDACWQTFSIVPIKGDAASMGHPASQGR